MTFIWFSFGLDSTCLKASFLSALNFAYQNGDSFYVIEEENNPVQEKIKLFLKDNGVKFLSRGSFNNLNGSREAVQKIIDFMIAVSDSSGEIWKVDSDTLILSNKWRSKTHIYDFICPKSLEFDDAGIGISYIVKKKALESINLSSKDYSKRMWPEDLVISQNIYKNGFKTNLMPFDFNSGWAGWSYQKTATPEAYLRYDIVSFGNRFNIPGSNSEQRTFAGKEMFRFLNTITNNNYSI